MIYCHYRGSSTEWQKVPASPEAVSAEEDMDDLSASASTRSQSRTDEKSTSNADRSFPIDFNTVEDGNRNPLTQLVHS